MAVFYAVSGPVNSVFYWEGGKWSSNYVLAFCVYWFPILFPQYMYIFIPPF